MIDITKIDLVKFVKKVYEMSIPVGLGMLHYKEGSLTDTEATNLINLRGNIAVNMDYVSGRCCKMVVFRNDKGLFIREDWFDHTDTQLKSLLSGLGVECSGGEEHSIACHCNDCQKVRR